MESNAVMVHLTLYFKTEIYRIDSVMIYLMSSTYVQ